jgi:hypothetical protein
MGCDTHMYIEYKSKDSYYWKSFGKRINPGRNYAMFGILAEVRSTQIFSFPPKGLPDGELGYESGNDNQIYISKDGEGEHETTLETATRWVKDGSSEFINGHEGKPLWVTNPDWHSHSWLTLAQYQSALAFYNKNYPGQTEPEYEAIRASLEVFDNLGYDTRLVFWFDN